ncbi:MAG: Zn-ribbon domain-containing OB-fold protein [Candidatus Altiarchaeota archaeon]
MSKRIPLHWRLIPHRYRLLGSECKRCNEKFFPRRIICPNCRRKGKVEGIKFSGKGEVYSYTVIHVASRGFELLTPYVIAIIKLVEGPMITAQVVDCKPDDVEVGMKVTMIFRKISVDGKKGIIRYGYKFKLV